MPTEAPITHEVQESLRIAKRGCDELLVESEFARKLARSQASGTPLRIKLGLDPKVARLLAEQTMYGTAKFLRESGMELRPFIEGVCTKGGTTAAGMEKLDVPAFKEIVAETLAAAARRSKELA